MNAPQWVTEFCVICEAFTRQLVAGNAAAHPRLPVYAGEKNPFAPDEEVHTCRDCGQSIIVRQP